MRCIGAMAAMTMVAMMGGVVLLGMVVAVTAAVGMVCYEV